MLFVICRRYYSLRLSRINENYYPATFTFIKTSTIEVNIMKELATEELEVVSGGNAVVRGALLGAGTGASVSALWGAALGPIDLVFAAAGAVGGAIYGGYQAATNE
ncbi:hypothetical protein [Atlantibacter hermannii]|uniref:hypothetical protein n=1 Tax=Atlantibacter hermannii TaxID=565 RepID=UPI0028A7301E|nr:hypothetical protein [Atlantibacter hermannii]